MKPKKHPTAVDRFNDLREMESERLEQKRKMLHEQEMGKVEIKRMKYELKLIHAKNDTLRLSRRRDPSASPRRSPCQRRHDIDHRSPVSPPRPTRHAGPSRYSIADPARPTAAAATPLTSPSPAAGRMPSPFVYHDTPDSSLPNMYGLPQYGIPEFSNLDWGIAVGTSSSVSDTADGSADGSAQRSPWAV